MASGRLIGLHTYLDRFFARFSDLGCCEFYRLEKEKDLIQTKISG
jgi:hypothetical protein